MLERFTIISSMGRGTSISAVGKSTWGSSVVVISMGRESFTIRRETSSMMASGVEAKWPITEKSTSNMMVSFDLLYSFFPFSSGPSLQYVKLLDINHHYLKKF